MALYSCRPLVLVNQVLQVPVVYVVVLPIWRLVELQIVREFHGGAFLFCY